MENESWVDDEGVLHLEFSYVIEEAGDLEISPIFTPEREAEIFGEHKIPIPQVFLDAFGELE